ncbi:iron complex outermembrane receptor protein [Sphingobacterium allocomposti]|uniref:Iron complex outermembrane receptor protein n=1 Tax=Sphingobacterium allocomposti TaxID=415956 RepID=A0A5S5DK60_9SPHI|nr:SusC/RagA family TonB-linked outer membrane protein [Sphingobacterium composti Yoo et al. 2007 non Ten et al. 2007]TYP96340.1 iron complex outermembrane receptor protein [Sphingobacterium composti Yoo et al. 2007 non Ten et al. 2007]
MHSNLYSEKMRLAITLGLFVLMFLSATLSYAKQDPQNTCSIHLTNAGMKEVIDVLEKQTDYRFLYMPNNRTKQVKISIKQDNKPLRDILQQIEKQTNLKFEIADKTIYVKERPSQAQQHIRRGVVVDEISNQGLSAASVHVRGKSAQAFTNGEGYFEIAAEPNDILTFSYIGYQPASLSINSLTDTIRLTPTLSQMDEVVVVGYGTQSRRLISTSVTTVKQENFNRGGFSNPLQLLQGKVAGLNVTRSGDPNETPSVSLRGPSTLRTGAAQEPFYVIDGIPGADPKLVAPDDIEDISVLKDASASAIYGTRAANGVIMITTKSGRAEGTSVSYSGYVGNEKSSKTIEMMDAAQRKAYLETMGRSAKPMDEQGADTDWQKEISRIGSIQNHNLSLSGGLKNASYNASLNYFDNNGILRNSGLERLTGRLNLSQRLLDDQLTIGINLNNASSNSQLIPNQDLVLYNALRFMPTVPVFQPDGTYTEDLPRVQYYNPVALQNQATERLRNNTTLLNVNASLRLPFNLLYNISATTQKDLYNRGIYYESGYSLKQGFNGEAYRSSYENTRKMLESFLKFENRWSQHHLEVLGGYSWQEDLNGDGFQANNRNFPSDDLGFSNIGLGSPQGNFRTDWGTNQYAKLRLISFYGRLNYNLKERYLLQVSLRRDASSAFGENNRWGTFPAGSIAWRISEEPFMNGQRIFDDLKIRAGYGITGNSLGFNPLISKVRYGNAGTFFYDGNFTTAIFATQNANPDLRWEKTAMANVAVDASLLNNRLHVTAEYYDKKTSDLIWDYNVSTTQYFVDRYTANVGDIRNKGFEITLDIVPIQNKTFRWVSGLNVAHNSNTLVSLSNDLFASDSIPQGYPGGQGQSGVAVQILKAGYPIGQFFTFQYMGKNEAGVSQFLDKAGNITTQPIDFQDYRYAGSAQPKLLFGWNNSLFYKNIDLNVFFRGSLGGKVFNATYADLNRPYEVESYNLPVFAMNESPEDGNANRYSDRYIENASYVRLDNATLGYTFTNIPKVSKLRIYLTGNNLALISKYRGLDPEINLGGLTPGIDNKNYYPRTRSFLFGLNVNF